MIAVSPKLQPITGPERGSPGAIALVGMVVLTGITFLFVTANYAALVYVIIAACSLVAFAAPARWGLAALLLFGGIGGILKDIAAYETVAHLGNDFVLISLLLGHAARAMMRRQPLIPDFPYKRILGFLIVVACFMTFLPITRPLLALGGWKGYVIPALVVPVAYLGLREPGSSRPVVGTIIVIGLANAVASLYEQSLGPTVVQGWGPGFIATVASYTFAFDNAGNLVWRAFGLTQGAGEAAVIEVLAATTLMYLAFGRRPMIQWMAGIGAALCAVAVLESSVRTAVLMLIVGALGAVMLRGRRRPSSLMVGLMVVAVVGGTVYFVFRGAPGAVQGRLGGLLDANTYLSTRGAVIALIGQAALHLPLGLGMGRVVPGSDLLASLAGVQNAGAATENVLLAMMYELGWAGLVFIVVLYWQVGGVVWKYLRKRVNDREGGLAAVLLLVLFLAGLSGPTLISQPDNLFFWIFATLAYIRLQPQGAVQAEAPVPTAMLPETPVPALF